MFRNSMHSSYIVYLIIILISICEVYCYGQNPTLVVIDGFSEYLSGICKLYCKQHNIRLIEAVSPYICNIFHSQGRTVPDSLQAPIEDDDIIQWAIANELIMTDNAVSVSNIEINPNVCILSESDSGVSTAEKIAAVLNLPGNGISPHLRHKYLSNERAKQRGIEVVKQKLVSTIDDAIAFATELWKDLPVHEQYLVIKPYRGVASDGVYLCKNLDEIKIAFENLYNKPRYGGGINDAVLIQEYADGPEYAVDTVTQNGETKIVAVWKYRKLPANGAPFVYQCSELILPTTDIDKAVCSYCIDVLKAQDLKWGPTHTEIKYTRNGPRLIEINPRWHAQNFPPIVNSCLGYDAITCTLDAFFFPEKFQTLPHLPSKMTGAGRILHLISYFEGKIKSINHIEDIHNLESTLLLNIEADIGEDIVKTVDIRTDCGYVLQYHEDPMIVERDYETIVQYEKDLFDIWHQGEEDDVLTRRTSMNLNPITNSINAGSIGNEPNLDRSRAPSMQPSSSPNSPPNNRDNVDSDIDDEEDDFDDEEDHDDVFEEKIPKSFVIPISDKAISEEFVPIKPTSSIEDNELEEDETFDDFDSEEEDDIETESSEVITEEITLKIEQSSEENNDIENEEEIKYSKQETLENKIEVPDDPDEDDEDEQETDELVRDDENQVIDSKSTETESNNDDQSFDKNDRNIDIVDVSSTANNNENDGDVDKDESDADTNDDDEVEMKTRPNESDIDDTNNNSKTEVGDIASNSINDDKYSIDEGDDEDSTSEEDESSEIGSIDNTNIINKTQNDASIVDEIKDTIDTDISNSDHSQSGESVEDDYTDSHDDDEEDEESSSSDQYDEEEFDSTTSSDLNQNISDLSEDSHSNDLHDENHLDSNDNKMETEMLESSQYHSHIAIDDDQQHDQTNQNQDHYSESMDYDPSRRYENQYEANHHQGDTTVNIYVEPSFSYSSYPVETQQRIYMDNYNPVMSDHPVRYDQLDDADYREVENVANNELFSSYDEYQEFVAAELRKRQDYRIQSSQVRNPILSIFRLPWIRTTKEFANGILRRCDFMRPIVKGYVIPLLIVSGMSYIAANIFVAIVPVILRRFII